MTIDEQKRAAGEAAAQLVEAGMTVGLGTGSTATWFVKALGARGLSIRCVATSLATADLARSVGLEVIDLNLAGQIDVTVDGADEIGPGLALIKGGGAALLREKLVWEASKRCVVIADEAKNIKLLGSFPLPIEVVSFGHRTTAIRIVAALSGLGISGRPILRQKGADPLITDNGNLIYDVRCERIEDPKSLAWALKALTGVVEHGLFIDLAECALLGTPQGVRTLYP